MLALPRVPYVSPVPPAARRLLLIAATSAVAACVENANGTLEVTADADSVQVVTGIADTAFVRLEMPNAPVVVVKDSRGFRIPNARVTFFTPSSANGRVDGAVVRTDNQGLARPGAWIAGPDSGTDTLVAYVVGPPGARATRATFTARVIDPCQRPLAYFLGGTVQGSLTGRGCVGADTSLLQPYRFTVNTAGLYQFTSTSAAFPSSVEVTRITGFPVAIYDGQPAATAGVRVALAPGTYDVRAGALQSRSAVGAFTLSSGPGTIPTGCSTTSSVLAFMMPGTAVSSTFSSNDCSWQYPAPSLFNGQAPFDAYAIYVPPGQQIVVRLQSTQVDALLTLLNGNLTPLNANDNGGGGTNALLQFSALSLDAAPGQGAVAIIVASSKNQLGAYTLSIDGIGP